MIRYTLECDNDHRFDSWFASASAYDALHGAGHVACVMCGSTTVEKSLMAPAVSTDKHRITAPAPTAPDAPRPNLTSTDSPQEQAAAAIRQKVEKSAEYVGPAFAKEARAIHDGEATDRPIYGEAKLADAARLIADGVPVLPLPFGPKDRPKRTN